MEITKQMIEEQLGYEIVDFKLEPIYEGNKCIGLSINVKPKSEIKFIDIKIKIGKSSDFNFDEI